jgi:hypothetical protein
VDAQRLVAIGPFAITVAVTGAAGRDELDGLLFLLLFFLLFLLDHAASVPHRRAAVVGIDRTVSGLIVGASRRVVPVWIDDGTAPIARPCVAFPGSRSWQTTVSHPTSVEIIEISVATREKYGRGNQQ